MALPPTILVGRLLEAILKAKEVCMGNYKTGEIVTVRVERIVDYGAFARTEDGYLSGLIYFAEIPNAAHGRVGDVLHEGECVDVEILPPKKPGKTDFSIKRACKKVEAEEAKRAIEELERSDAEQSNIRNIWKIFTEVNYYLLQFKKLPIAILPTSVKLDVSHSRLKLSVNSEVYSQNFIAEIEHAFKATAAMLTDGCWEIWANVDAYSVSIREELQTNGRYCHVDFKPYPVVEGCIFNCPKADDVGEKLKEYFPNIEIENKGACRFSFMQSYKNHFQGEELAALIAEVLDELKKLGLVFEYDFVPLKDGLDRFVFRKNHSFQLDNEIAAIESLRGEEFLFGSFSIGRLSKVAYPNLTFTFVPKESHAVIEAAIDQHSFVSIRSDVTAESEKVNRLRESFGRITTCPEKLTNPSLAKYLFDATQARPNNHEDVVYRESIIRENLLNESLNQPQINAIAKAVEALDLALIQGPPGTGKSTAIAELIWQTVLSKTRDARAFADPILLTSEANLAVDNALDRLKFSIHNLVKPVRIASAGKVSAEGLPYSVIEMKKWAGVELLSYEVEEDQTIRDSSEYKDYKPENVVLNRWMKNICSRSASTIESDSIRLQWQGFLMDLPQSFRKIVYKKYLANCNVVGATCSSLAEINYGRTEERNRNTKSRFLRKYQSVFGLDRDLCFDIVIQDEASKATPAELALPLVYGKKAIVIGDHRQLPPNLDREEILYKLHLKLRKCCDEKERAHVRQLEEFVSHHFDKLEKSHFERLYEQIDDSLKGQFLYQYRMHPDINDVIEQFYKHDGGLECGFRDLDFESPAMEWYSRYHGIDIEGLVSPQNHVIWIDVKTPEVMEGSSRANAGEVAAVDWVLSEFEKSASFGEYIKKFKKEEDREIGVISFYGAQLKLLDRKCKAHSRLSIRLSSVDRFQGMERNIIIVSMVRSDKIAQTLDQAPDHRIYGELGYPVQSSLGFAKSPNRLNVALSRAKRLLIIVGNSELFTAYKSKDGEQIYKNVYNKIRDNPNGRIVTWTSSILQKEPRPLPKNHSVNLNTRDVKKTDTELRKIKTVLCSDSEIESKFAILELSTKAVKLLIGKDGTAILSSARFSFDNFIRDADKVEAGQGLDGQNQMDLNYFRRKVIPSIKKMKRKMRANGVGIVYTVATAAYRTASNREDILLEIRQQTGLNVRILSKQEESIATYYAYMFSTKSRERLNSSSYVIMIDQGGGSTEVSVFEKQNVLKSYSTNLGTTSIRHFLLADSSRDTDLAQAFSNSDKKIRERLYTLFKNMDEYLDVKGDILCIGVGSALVGKRSSSGLHDSVFTKDKILERINKAEELIFQSVQTVGGLSDRLDRNQYRRNDSFDSELTARLGLPMFLILMEKYDIQEIRFNGTGLWYGIYFQKLLGSLEEQAI